ncbi:sodium-dependent transporter [Methanotorris formicicus]|uniref:sodium-dependent transporter n=1 Tax=Methanotorris formicicus TaxID=213185 RepID=UPI003A4E0C40
MKLREQWGSKLGFILAAVGSAIGLGNIWRFGYMVYTNGGGAFLIPYFVALFCVGISLMILELALGHLTKGSAPLAFRKIHEKSEWVGWIAVIAGFVITTYYNVIIAWSLYYLLNIIAFGLPNDPNNFFFNDVLNISSSVGEIGGFVWGVLVSVIAIWAINFFIVNCGVKKGLEKANKISIPLLFILVLILVFRGITLPGGLEGVSWYLTPNFAVLKDPEIWINAFSQIFFSLSLGFGIMIAYAGYLPKKSDITTSAFTISLLNCGFSFLAGFAVFGTLGYMAYATGMPLDEVVSQGIALAFVTFPKAISLLPVGSVLMGVVFFFALVIAGISSSVSLIEALVSAIMDKFDVGRKKALTLVTVLGLLGSSIYATKGGLYYLDMVDHFASGYLLPISGVLEVIVVVWIFGGERILNYVNRLSEIKIGSWWKYLAGILAPLVLLTIISLDIVSLINEPYGGYSWKYLGFAVLIIPIAFILAFILSKIPWKRKIEIIR